MTRPTIDDLEMLNPMELCKLFYAEIFTTSPNLSYIQDILTVGYLIDSSDDRGKTALHYAVEFGKVEVVEFLLHMGADINVVMDNGYTPLHFAAKYGYLEVSKFLISNGADIQARDKDGRTAWDMVSHYSEIRKKLPELEPK